MVCIHWAAWVILALVLIPIILQVIGMSGSEWIKGITCSSSTKPDCCSWNISDSIRCNGKFDLNALDSVSFDIVLTSSCILIIPVFCFLAEVFCTDDICIALLRGFCFLLYPFAGLLTFIGCMVAAGKFSGHSVGNSFHQCLCAGLYVIILTSIGFTYICCQMKKEMEASSAVGAVEEKEQGGEPQIIITKSVSVEEKVVHHDMKHRTVTEFVIRLDVFHTVSHHTVSE